MSAADSRYMRLALALGARGLGRVWPNPAVGAVIVSQGRIVGRGWTQPGGRPHAETGALTQAGAAAQGATAYVSLEPCAHHGQTPPCAEALIAAGVGRVVTALQDPDARVAGKGHALLRVAGIEVTQGVEAEAARIAHGGHILRVTEGRPWLTLKLAMSLDGRIATAAGESRWISGPEARAMVHGLRASHDAVLVGGGTARADDPMLTIRELGVGHQPVRVVASRGLDLPGHGKLAASAGEVPLWLLHGQAAEVAAWQARGARCFAVAEAGDGLDPTAMLQALGAAGLTRVLCEGGGALAASFLKAGLVDELVVVTAGMALGTDARPGLAALGIARLADAQRFRLADLRAVGGDVVHVWRRG